MPYNLKLSYQNHIAKGLPPIFLAFAYFIVSALPLFLISLYGLPARTFPNEIATHFGLIAYIWIILSFLLSGRFKSISGKIGIDKTIRFHQFMAIVLGIFIFFTPLSIYAINFASSSMGYKQTVFTIDYLPCLCLWHVSLDYCSRIDNHFNF